MKPAGKAKEPPPLALPEGASAATAHLRELAGHCRELATLPDVEVATYYQLAAVHLEATAAIMDVADRRRRHLWGKKRAK